ncbi:flavodoxin domain-containing protein [Pengzhenrongella sicca]|uniref:Flavodoxin n=1 Tax=Pengzhenrongella sicca TaxID=2819238 RepID=A0A8A4ZCW9_9MICO|nr:flavodoxin domain-containing protein [Pengzhenrongella sicca]QTE28406.1 flavodoxin [Pengzhenrongella sicca]
MQVLVTVGSRHGSTREIGAAIAEVLERAGHGVTILDPDDVTSIDEYDAVVLGSAVYVGRLTASVRALADRFEAQLAEVALWLFWSGPIGNPPRPSERPDDVGYLVRRLAPVGQHEFGGRVERSELGMAERGLVAMVGAKPGDYRDFEEIDLWAESIAAKLHARPRAGRG